MAEPALGHEAALAPRAPTSAPGPAAVPRGGFVRDVLAPFVATRAALVLVGAFARAFGASWHYPVAAVASRGWAFTAVWPVDLFGRWDTHWYLDLAANGYLLRGPLATTQSNVAFFPAYPALVAAVHRLLPFAWRGETALFVAAVALSNVLALAALALLHRRVVAEERDPALARRTVLYLLLFPAGFFLSCAYSESLFLLLTLAAFELARKERWVLAAGMAALLAVSRPTGIIVVLPLAWMGAVQAGVARRRLPRVAVIVLVPAAALAAHAAHLWRVTGEPLAMIRSQVAWGRGLTAPWRTLLAPNGFHPYVGPLELAAVAGFVALGVRLWRRRRVAEALFVLGSVSPVLLSGTLQSSLRFMAVLFPGFVELARAGRSERADRAMTAVFAATQALLFLAWARFYWVS